MFSVVVSNGVINCVDLFVSILFDCFCSVCMFVPRICVSLA